VLKIRFSFEVLFFFFRWCYFNAFRSDTMRKKLDTRFPAVSFLSFSLCLRFSIFLNSAWLLGKQRKREERRNLKVMIFLIELSYWY
jgi:hypothetical protein